MKTPKNVPTPAETAEPTPELGMDEGALGTNATGLYFTKAPRIEAWHAFTQDHEPVGMVLPAAAPASPGTWAVKIGRTLVGTTFTSATAARAYLMGWHDRDTNAAVVSAQAPAPAGEKPEGGYHADASTVVRS